MSYTNNHVAHLWFHQHKKHGKRRRRNGARKAGYRINLQNSLGDYGLDITKSRLDLELLILGPLV